MKNTLSSISTTLTFSGFGILIIAFVFATLLSIRDGDGGGGSGNNTTVQLAVVFNGVINLNLIGPNGTSFSNVPLEGFDVFPLSFDLASFYLNSTAITKRVRLTRVGYYTGNLFLIIATVNVFPQGAQQCTLVMVPSNVPGFYGAPIVVYNSVPTDPFPLLQQSSVLATAFNFYYNGTIPYEFPMLLSCDILDPLTTVYTNLVIILNIARVQT